MSVWEYSWIGWLPYLVPHTLWSDCLPSSQHHHISKHLYFFPFYIFFYLCFCAVSESLSLGDWGGFMYSGPMPDNQLTLDPFAFSLD